MSMGKLPDETRANREVVDLVREVLGMAPLYTQRQTATHSWLSDMTAAYNDARPTRTGTRGSPK